MTYLFFLALLCQCLSTSQSATLISKEEGQEMHRDGFPLMIKALEKTQNICPNCELNEDFVKSTLKKIYTNFRDNYATVMSSVNANLSSAGLHKERPCTKSSSAQECAEDIVRSYTKEGPLYTNVNRALRQQSQGYNPDINDVRLGTYALVLDSILRYGALERCPRNVTYRGLSLPASDLNQYEINKSFCWLAFTSTSTNVDTAKVFLKQKENPVLFSITSFNIAGWQPRDISKISVFNEEECLYQAGTIFKVRSIKQTTDYTEIKLDTDSVHAETGQFINGGLPAGALKQNEFKTILIVHLVVFVINL